jgi:protein involved in polysaccharide export with SLBB domain
MKTIVLVFLSIIGFCLGSLFLPAISSTIYAAEESRTSNLMSTEIQAMSKYKLGSGDRIEISVFDETELSLVTLLGDTGIINYPFLGELKLTGLTVKQVEEKITKGLKGPYLVNPSVQVSVVEYRPFFIDGEVNQPGGYPYQPGLNISKAVALAGGFTERASKTSIYITRASDNNVKKIKVSLNDPIYPGDILEIEESFF